MVRCEIGVKIYVAPGKTRRRGCAKLRLLIETQWPVPPDKD
jgi:hypothetical protein